jgi:hypothetical protein
LVEVFIVFFDRRKVHGHKLTLGFIPVAIVSVIEFFSSFVASLENVHLAFGFSPLHNFPELVTE